MQKNAWVMVGGWIVAAAIAAPAGAAGPDISSPSNASILIDAELLMAGLGNGHPDLYYRRNALQDLENGRYKRAMRQLRRAASYSDKPAQAQLAEIHWQGSHGQQQDRPAAYAWIDLAAERGYPELVTLRERYWRVMTAAEQQQALAVGKKLYARYGDDVAQPRLARILRQRSRNVAGSRTGFAANTTILSAMPGSGSHSRSNASTMIEGDFFAAVTTIAGHKFYDPKYWQPDLYFQQKDLEWRIGVTEHRLGTAEVGELSPVRP